MLELDDPFLSHLALQQQTTLLLAFGAAYRKNRFTRKRPNPPGHGTIGAAIDSVAKTYREHGRTSPLHGPSGERLLQVKQFLDGLKNLDPPPKRQKAVPLSMIRAGLTRSSNSPLQQAMSELFCGAIFFAMRSCEYLNVQGTRRTKLLRVRNIRFYIGRRLLHHSSRELDRADSVSITFEFQKTGIRDSVITQHANDDPLVCPVLSWIKIVRRVLSYHGSSSDSPVNLAKDAHGNVVSVSSDQALQYLRQLATELGPDVLGFTADEIGTHSIRSGGAMAMYLSFDIPVYTIMLIGRWSSDAFLLYIRAQVQQFSKGVSKKMIRNLDFFTIPDAAAQPALREDPRSRSGLHKSGLGLLHGPPARSLASQPAFSPFH